jgi:hypothetical protein
MNTGLIIQYATLLSLLIGGLGVAVAFFIHREQVNTQIFLTLMTRYDELLQSASPGIWLDMAPGTRLPERTQDLTISALRFCTMFSLTYLLFREHRLPRAGWHLILHSAECRLRSPLFVREWEHLRSEFESLPEFIALVDSVQRGTEK